MKLSEGVEQAIHCTAFLAGLSEDGVLSWRQHRLNSRRIDELPPQASAGAFRRRDRRNDAGRSERWISAGQGATKDITMLDIVLAVEGPAPAFRCAEIRQRGRIHSWARYFTQALKSTPRC